MRSRVIVIIPRRAVVHRRWVVGQHFGRRPVLVVHGRVVRLGGVGRPVVLAQGRVDGSPGVPSSAPAPEAVHRLRGKGSRPLAAPAAALVLPAFVALTGPRTRQRVSVSAPSTGATSRTRPRRGAAGVALAAALFWGPDGRQIKVHTTALFEGQFKTRPTAVLWRPDGGQ